MTKKKTTASADQKPMPITGAKPSRKKVGARQIAFIEFEGEAPEDGAAITFTAINGVTYTGTVKTAVSLDGVVTCELSHGPYLASK